MAACLLPVAPRLVLRASSAARCARADGRLAPTTCQSRTSMGTRVISPVWPAAAPSRVAVCSDRGEFAKSKSGVGPPYWGGRNGRRNLAILPSQTTISSATIRARPARGGYTVACSTGRHFQRTTQPTHMTVRSSRTAATAIATWAQSAQQPPAPAPSPSPSPSNSPRTGDGHDTPPIWG